MPERRALSAVIAELLGYLAVVLVGVGALAGSQEWLPAEPAFLLFGVGLVLGVLTLLLGLLGIARTGATSGRTGRRRAVIGVVVGGVLAVLFVSLLAPGSGLPAINDITTDLEDPPVFDAAAREPANRSRDMAYPGDAFAAQQRRGYPDLGSLRLDRPPEQAWEDALAAAERLGWNVIDRDREGLRFEAYEITAFFHFVDDVVVRVEPAPGGGSVVDVRSKSRDGKGDLGANAARIRRLFAELQ